MTARLYTIDPVEGYRPKTFAGHRDAVLAAAFSADQQAASHPLYSAHHY
jgi:periodic tryptophan protein 2